MKKKRVLFGIGALVLATLLIATVGRKPLHYLFRELEYRWGEPTAAARSVHTYARENGIPYGEYPQDLIDLLEKNPETESFVLNYPNRTEAVTSLAADRETVPLFLQWDPNWGYETYGSSYLAVTGCGPTCLSMAGYYLTGDETMTPAAVAAFSEENGYYAPGYGSSWTLISEGAEKLGLTAKELPLVKGKLVDAVEAGHPVILALGPGDFTTTGHYIVLTSWKDGAFRVNDPNSRIRSEKLWTYEELESQIRNIWEISL